MDKETIVLAYKIDKLRFSLNKVKNELLSSDDLTLEDKNHLIIAVTHLKELVFVREAFDWAFDEWLSTMADNFIDSSGGAI